jgi:hypothetical protein
MGPRFSGPYTSSRNYPDSYHERRCRANVSLAPGAAGRQDVGPTRVMRFRSPIISKRRYYWLIKSPERAPTAGLTIPSSGPVTPCALPVPAPAICVPSPIAKSGVPFSRSIPDP